jgi:hypothetical protein
MKFRDVTPLDILEMLERRVEEDNLHPSLKDGLMNEIENLRNELNIIYNNDFDERLIETCD